MNRWLLLPWLLLALSACAGAPKTPVADLSEVRAALTAARAADAEHFAPVELKLAEEALALAERGLAVKRPSIDIGRVVQLALVQAELARVKSEGTRLREAVQSKERENAALERELLAGENR